MHTGYKLLYIYSISAFLGYTVKDSRGRHLGCAELIDSRSEAPSTELSLSLSDLDVEYLDVDQDLWLCF